MKTVLPRLLVIAGFPFVAAAYLLAARLIWEQTILSWSNGLQMVGFSLMHSGLGVILLLAVFVGLLWVAAMLVAMAVKRSFGGPLAVSLLLAYGIALVLMSTPYGFWQRLFIDKYLPSRAGELFTFAAATGDLKTVSSLLEHGVNINVQGRYGTALHGAAVENNHEMMAFLIEHGANVNALNAFGDSPLGYANDANKETRDFLLNHGGKFMRGNIARRQQIIEEEVRRDMAGMDERRKQKQE